MLLWLLILSLYGAMVPIFGKALPETLKARALAIQGFLSFGFIAFVIFASNPFWRLAPMPPDGMGLNPVLQDPGLAIHPPLLYFGYVGFSLSFSFACAALIEGRIDMDWARWLRPWVLLAWSFLTLGITIGSLWAYYELGWGGWWVWDPVENVSFMPWLAGTALLHSIMVMGTRHRLPSWTVLLSILTFSLCLLGTFAVRSGFMTSIHSFAVDKTRGLFILSILAVYTGMALALYGFRAPTLRARDQFQTISRTGALILNNLLLMICTATVFLGTFYPVFIEALTTDKLTIGPPYFNIVFVPITILLIFAMAIGPLLKWDRGTFPDVWKILTRIGPVFIAVLILCFISGFSILAAASMAICTYLVAGVAVTVWRKRKILKQQSAAFYGFVTGHLGVAIVGMAITALTVWGSSDFARLKIGETVETGGYEFTLTGVTAGQRANYEYLRSGFEVKKDNQLVTPLNSEIRYYPVRQTYTTEAGFRLAAGDTIFASITADGDQDKGWVVRVYKQPFVVWIWIGGILIALAGFISLFDRRLRISGTASDNPDEAQSS